MLRRFDSDARGLRRLRRFTSALAAARSYRAGWWEARRLDPLAMAPELPPPSPDKLRLFTLNVAHGRRIGPHQTFQRRRTMQGNLATIAGMLRRIQPDVAALQEADGPSAWSGNFDHVATLARLAELADHYRGDHNPLGFGRFRLASGTALLARQPLRDPASHRFAQSWRDTKGFVKATVTVPAWGNREVDLVSVHLDFLAPTVRHRQIRQMVDALAPRRRPLVVLGDLNCCWHQEPESLELLTRTLGLAAYEPHAACPTYPSTRPQRRLDWILISAELEFSEHVTVEAPLSDHLGVVADLVPRAA